MSSFGNRFKRGGGHFASSARYEALDGESLMTAQEQVKRCCCCCCCCFLSALSSFARDDDMMIWMKMSRRFSRYEENNIPIPNNNAFDVLVLTRTLDSADL